MASIMSRLKFSRKPNSKVYNHNPAGSNFYGKNHCDLNLKLEPSRLSPKPSCSPSINQFQHKIPASNCRDYSGSSFGIKRRKNNLCESGGFDSHSVIELENKAVYKAQETTQKINGCLKVAEEMRQGASRVLVNLHQQSEHIIRTHQAGASIDHNLRRGEKLLGSLGGLFSKKWRPKKTREIKGPVLSLFARDDSSSRRNNHMEQRKKLGLSSPKSQWSPKRFRSEPSTAIERAELEKAKQDDALSDLSNLLEKLKAMAVDMGSEIDRNNKALDHMHDDVDELNIRIRGANIRARRLLRR